MIIKDEIFARIDDMRPAERKVARVLLASYPSAGLTSATKLAKAAGTSTPTVLRLIARLGLGSYAEFQKSLRDEIMHQLNSPVYRAAHRTSDNSAKDVVLGSFIAQRRDLVEGLFSTVPPKEFDRAVHLLQKQSGPVLISGGYFSRYIAEFLARQLDQIITNVHFTPQPMDRDLGEYLALRKGSLAVVLDFRRYEFESKRVVDFAKRAGANVLVITDEALSPCAADADVVLPVKVDGIPFDSLAGLVVLVEALTEAVFHSNEQRSLKRMKQWEDSIHLHRISSETAVPIASSDSTL